MTETTSEGKRDAFFALRSAILIAFATYRATVTSSEAEGEADALYAEMRNISGAMTDEADIYKNVGKHRWPYVDRPRKEGDDPLPMEPTPKPRPLTPADARRGGRAMKQSTSVELQDAVDLLRRVGQEQYRSGDRALAEIAFEATGLVNAIRLCIASQERPE